MKKDVLFVMNNLNCGGAEKAFIFLLETIDYDRYNVDLLLFKHEGIFMDKIPEQVNVLHEPVGYRYFDMSLRAAVSNSIKNRRPDIAYSRIRAGYIFKTEKNRTLCEQKVWKHLSRSLEKLNKVYDVAIGFLEKNPIYFCVDKVQATRKIGFIHNDYDQLGLDPKIDMKFFEQLDHIVTVSEGCVTILKQRFPMYVNKIKLIHNLFSPDVIMKMAVEELGLKKDKGITITSVGRLHEQKGFDLAIKACEKLVEKGYKITWYVVGEGEARKKLEQLIKDKQLEDIFILMGQKENPYPYIRKCDVYVQTSLYEGRCLTITEAKILRKPIVSTNFKVIYDQIIHEKNGLIVDQDPESIYKGIKKLIDHKELRRTLILNLSKENLGSESEVQKLYELMD